MSTLATTTIAVGATVGYFVMMGVCAQIMRKPVSSNPEPAFWPFVLPYLLGVAIAGAPRAIVGAVAARRARRAVPVAKVVSK